MGDGLRVRGGAGGVTADLTDMRRVADELDRAGDRLRHIAAEARRLTRDGDLLASAVLSPGTAARATAQLLDAAYGPHGTTAVALTLELGAVGLRSVAELFETRDETVAAVVDRTERVAGGLLGRIAIPAGVGAYLVHLGSETNEVSWSVAAGLLTGRMSLGEAVDALRAIPGGAGSDLADDLHVLLLEHPELTDAVTGGAPEFTSGLLSSVAPGLGAILGTSLPRDFEDVTSLLIAGGQLVPGWLRDGQVRVTATGDPRTVAVGDLRDLMVGQRSLMASVQDDHAASAIRVIDVGTGGEARWVVQVPGTQEWPVRTGLDPSDLTTNLLLEAKHDAELLDAIAEAMRLSGVQPDDPVLLTGHSQGGIAAAAFASHGEHGQAFNVTHVVTAGSPIGRIPLPGDVQVLALEHTEDPVPRLEGDPNPDRPNVTTVTRSVEDEVRADAATAGQPVDVIQAHGIGFYADTAALVDDSTDPGLQAFVASARPFLAGTGDATDHTIQRSHP